ncbi:AIM24 family protein [Brevibacterium daeguense]|uniref:AIM24 family protein n=1 Tax=Brevibacterium daeguense TaxID=909936 RepID=A0ABP8EJ66_9MICO|nr:AIM24 family protein [Brevibacterium daeguense]
MRSELFAKRNAEQEINQRWTMQSSKMLRTLITPDAPMVATKGAMVAYQGNVEFSHQGSTSVGQFLKKAVTSEDTPMMKVEGHGEVFFARQASNIFLMQLEGPHDALTVNSSSLLAFDANLDWDIKRVRGMGAMASGAGLFNLELSGQGTAAICCQGDPMILDCSRTPTFVDPQAAVCWSANLAPGVKAAVGLGAFIGRGSGESFQLAFHGPGFVVVQPAETV